MIRSLEASFMAELMKKFKWNLKFVLEFSRVTFGNCDRLISTLDSSEVNFSSINFRKVPFTQVWLIII